MKNAAVAYLGLICVCVRECLAMLSSCVTLFVLLYAFGLKISRQRYLEIPAILPLKTNMFYTLDTVRARIHKGKYTHYETCSRRPYASLVELF